MCSEYSSTRGGKEEVASPSCNSHVCEEREFSDFMMRVKLGRLLGSSFQHSRMIWYTASGQPSGLSILYPLSTCCLMSFTGCREGEERGGGGRERDRERGEKVNKQGEHRTDKHL